ncbi:MAG: hypothetical protein HY900_05580 [Deltaproteobacteria bacterium]|nr:hypothetical protein [Deltaproteobacteria bacterium]
MAEPEHLPDDADLEGAEAALRRAFESARELGRRTHTPVWVLRDGRLVDLTAEEERRAGYVDPARPVD